MKTKSKNFGSFFVRVGAGFFAFWLLTMSAFTRVTAMSSKTNETEKFTNNILTLESQLKEVDGQETANLYAPLEMFSQSTIPTFYVGVYDLNGKLVASTGNYLKLPGGRIDLSRWLTEEEQNTLVRLQQESYYAANNGGDIYILTGHAWESGGQLIPKKLVYHKARRTENGWSRYGDYEVLYDREPDVSVDGMTLLQTGIELGISNPFTLEGFPAGGSVQEYHKARDNKKLQEMREWAQKIADNPSVDRERGAESSIYRVEWEYDGIVGANISNAKKYTFYCIWQYSPLKTAVKALVPLYAGTAALMLALTVILSYVLLRVWRKQERVERVRRETTAALAHELKTPLSVLSATAELLGDNLAPEKQAHYLDVIQQQAQRMDGSVRQMLELSRLETGAKALRRTAFSLAELAQERLQTALPTDSTIRTEFAVQGEYEVDADRALLTRALDALLENAVQHTPEGGCITVHLADGVLSVTNTGDAIPADALPRLWEAYYQADPSRSAKGDGLGLSIAKTVFDLHGYQCGAENTKIGPKFWFRFAGK